MKYSRKSTRKSTRKNTRKSTRKSSKCKVTKRGGEVKPSNRNKDKAFNNIIYEQDKINSLRRELAISTRQLRSPRPILANLGELGRARRTLREELERRLVKRREHVRRLDQELSPRARPSRRSPSL